MRNCLRCNVEMVENFFINNNGNAGATLNINCEFNNRLGAQNIPVFYANAAICPVCGHVELYTDRVDLVQGVQFNRGHGNTMNQPYGGYYKQY